MKLSMELLKSIGSSSMREAIQSRARHEPIVRPRGMVRFEVFENRRLIATIEDHNLFVNAGLSGIGGFDGRRYQPGSLRPR